MGLYTIIATSVLVVLLVLFALVAYRDTARLLSRRGGGMGLSRAWAVGRVTITEAWTNRLWVLPIIWFVVCILLCLLIRTYSPLEREQMDLVVLLRGQEFFVLLSVAVLAYISLPRERERRTIITTASKPVSRLELYLGKVMGLAAVAAMLLVTMGIITWITMNVVDFKIRHDARVLYAMDKRDYDNNVRHYPVPPGLRDMARNGLLSAQNYITARGGMRIAGTIDYTKKPPQRSLKGGSSESLEFQFPSLPVVPGHQPDFLFSFFPVRLPGSHGPIKLNLTLMPFYNTMKYQQATITLNRYGSAQWVPKHLASYFHYHLPNDNFNPGPLQLTVTCPTQLVYLFFRNGTHPQNSAVLAYNLDRTHFKNQKYPFIAPKANPVIVGFQAHGKQQVTGPDPKNPNVLPEVASFDFKHINSSMLPLRKGNFAVNMVLSVDKQSYEQLPARAMIVAYSLDRPTHRFVKYSFVDEKHITPVQLPARILDGGDLIINISSAVPGQWLGMKADSVRLVLTPSPFFLNLAKSEAVIFCEALLLAVIGVTAGIRLGWPVAGLTVAVFYMLGNLFTFVQRLFHDRGLGLYDYVTAQRLRGAWWFNIGSIISNVLTKMLYLLVHLVPNFTRFAPLHYIRHSRDMPWLVLGENLLQAALFMLPLLALGYLLIRRQELA